MIGRLGATFGRQVGQCAESERYLLYIALAVAQREEKWYLSLYMGLEAGVALDSVGLSGRQDRTAFYRSRRKYFSTVWFSRRDSCVASPSVAIRNQVLPFGASHTYRILSVLRSPQF